MIHQVMDAVFIKSILNFKFLGVVDGNENVAVTLALYNPPPAPPTNCHPCMAQLAHHPRP